MLLHINKWRLLLDYNSHIYHRFKVCFNKGLIIKHFLSKKPRTLNQKGIMQVMIVLTRLDYIVKRSQDKDLGFFLVTLS